MVRTCSVYGCISTTTLHKDLRFHRFPRDERCQSWIDACQRPDLKDKNIEQLYNLYVCSLHFEGWMYMKKKLKSAAIPILNLPSNSINPMTTQTDQIDDSSVGVSVAASTSAQTSQTTKNLTDHSPRMKKDQDPEEESFQHDVAILCNNCQNVILGFRYKCITCEDYDLCKKCEMMEIHSEHYMLRIPKPLKYKDATDIAQKLKQIFIPDSKVSLIKEEDPIEDTIGVCTDVETTQDDVSGDIHLSEQFKNIIQSEVSRVLDKCKETREPPLILQRKRKREVEREKVGDEKGRCYVNTKVNVAPEIEFLDTTSSFDTQESSIEVKQEMCDESELDVGDIINPYGTEDHL